MPESNDTPDGWSEAAAAKQSEALQGLRLQIDAVDRELLALLNRRASLSLEVGRVKANTSGPVFRPQRERQILDNLASENSGPLPEEHLRSIWHEIFASSRTLQRPVSVAYLGPEGTNSYFAAVDLLGNLMDYRPCKNFREAFAAVHGGECALGVIPLENVLQGSRGAVLRSLHGIRCVHPDRVGRPHPAHAVVRGIVSGSDQSGVFPSAGACPVPALAASAPARSLSYGLRFHRRRRAPGGFRAGERRHRHKSLSTMLGLPILAYNLEDEPTNQTRFVVIGPKPTDTSAANKTSVLFTLPDKPGSLAGILDLLFKAGVNLRKLESRPLRSQSWKYAFFADLETNLLKPELSGVLAELRNTCHSFRLLGCYTAGE